MTTTQAPTPTAPTPTAQDTQPVADTAVVGNAPAPAAAIETAEAAHEKKKTAIQKFNGAISNLAGEALSVVGVAKLTRTADKLGIKKIPTSQADFDAIKAANKLAVEEADALIASSKGKIKPETPGKGLLIGTLAFVGGQAITRWDQIAKKVRDVAPAWLINHSTQLHSSLRNMADLASTASCFWDGERNWSRFTANMVSLAALFPGLFYAEKPQTKEELDAYDKMGFFEYIGTKLKEAFNPKDHIRETVGLATMVNGVFNGVSGYKSAFRQEVDGVKVLLNPLKMPVKEAFGKLRGNSEFVAAFLTVTAGALINFVKESDKAWQLSTVVFLGRMPAKWHQSHTEFTKGKIKFWKEENGVNIPVRYKPGNYWQYVGFGLQQSSNVLSSTMAGAHKLEDGTVVMPGDLKTSETSSTGTPSALQKNPSQEKIDYRPGFQDMVVSADNATQPRTAEAGFANKTERHGVITPKSLMEHAERSDAALAVGA